VYHERNPSEQPDLQVKIEASVATDTHRKEVHVMGRTIADELKEEGMKEGLKVGELRKGRDILLLLLKRRFGKLPSRIVKRIEATDDIKELDAWLERFEHAKTLDDMQIESGS